MPVMANAGTLTAKKGRICVGGENAGTDFAKEGARNSIRKNFAKSMPGEGWKWSVVSGARRSRFSDF
jgi:hypothetical protein